MDSDQDFIGLGGRVLHLSELKNIRGSVAPVVAVPLLGGT
jgi:hypothetical protein